MKLFYPYNEILPRKKAHDVFIFHEGAALAALGIDVTLIIGKGSLSSQELGAYYGATSPAIKMLPIIRKNNPFNLSWNAPFFWQVQREIEKHLPRAVILSVLKQAAYHLQRKKKGVTYLYEVHQLSYYPDCIFDPKKVEFEREVFQKADIITVTTHALKRILENAPYALSVPIHVVPLAVKAPPLPPPTETRPLTLCYIGQLYSGQGIHLLLEALAQTTLHLKIIGGKEEEIAHFKKLAGTLSLSDRVEFLGFCPPKEIPRLVEEVHGFVAPFEATGRMPFVAHTKLYEYARMGRPIIAPHFPAVNEEFSKGVSFFEPGNISSLAHAMKRLNDDALRRKLQEEIETYSREFTWEKRAELYYKLLSLN